MGSIMTALTFGPSRSNPDNPDHPDHDDHDDHDSDQFYIAHAVEDLEDAQYDPFEADAPIPDDFDSYYMPDPFRNDPSDYYLDANILIMIGLDSLESNTAQWDSDFQDYHDYTDTRHNTWRTSPDDDEDFVPPAEPPDSPTYDDGLMDDMIVLIWL